MSRVLIVEDDALLREALVLTLHRVGIECEGAGDGEAGLEQLKKGGFDLVVTDMRMPKMSGLEMIQAAREALAQQPGFILLSGYHDYSEAELHAAGVSVVLSKPVGLSVLRQQVFAALGER